MDPVEESEPGPAAFPPPAPAATSAPGPKIFDLSPLPGNIYDVDRYCYAPSADVTSGNFAAITAFGAHYGHPIAIYNCPDLAAFQVKHASAIVRPFSEVPPPILSRGHVLLGTDNASTASASKRADSTSHSARSESLLPTPPSPSVSRGFDPPSMAAATQASGSMVAPGMASFSGFPAGPPSDPEGVDGPSSHGKNGGNKGNGGYGGSSTIWSLFLWFGFLFILY